MTGSHEVRGSIPLDSTNKFNELRQLFTVAFFYFWCRLGFILLLQGFFRYYIETNTDGSNFAKRLKWFCYR